MSRRTPAALLAIALAALSHARVSAHAGVRQTDPMAGATLGDTPAAIRISFSEKPDPALSDVRVLDLSGTPHQTGRPERVESDPLTIAVPVKPLDRGVYIVSFRIVSAIDGHATSGSYAFGVRATPEAGAAGTTVTSPGVSALEVFARWVFVGGLALMLGAATARLAGFGGARDLALASAGWLLAESGLGLLGVVQSRNAAVPLSSFLTSSVGTALIVRVAIVAGGGIALAAARIGALRATRLPMMLAALSAIVTMGVQAASGHAAAGVGWAKSSHILAQWGHFVAVGVWMGGLAALLLSSRHAGAEERLGAARRFSRVAALALLLVVTTGAIRSVRELASVTDLLVDDYGRAIGLKILLLGAIALLGAFNRWRSLAAARTLRLLRAAGSAELAIASIAFAAAAFLTTAPPPAAGLAAATGLIASGSDFGTSVRAELTMPSDQPGPNRFHLTAYDYDSGDPVSAEHVTLRFVSLDDPGVPGSSLSLAAGSDHSWVGSGPNLSFDGRWQVTALIERAGNSVAVPLAVETRTLPQFVSIDRSPGQPPSYTVEVKRLGHIRFALDPERPGPSTLRITCFNVLYEDPLVTSLVVTASGGEGPPSTLTVKRLERNRFAADLDLRRGRNHLAAVARTVDGRRLRAVVDIDVPAR